MTQPNASHGDAYERADDTTNTETDRPHAAFCAALADRYAVGAELGHGGMATVYVAEDLRHQRRVALKVLAPQLGAMLGAERFLAEIRVTANLRHPNLLPLFDSGEAAGLLYYVMPLIEGATLQEWLQRERQLPVDEAVRIVSTVAGALDYAHRQGVVHRDLKPGNILLQEGQPLVADFGIALAVTKAAGSRLTANGLSLGTPQYMSPEQAIVDPAVDSRSDIYSLACVLYELLAGDPPFTGSTMQAVIAKVVAAPPASVRTVRPSVPVHVDAALMRALAKLPADRYPTARAFADALVAPAVPVVPNAVEPKPPAAHPLSERRKSFAIGAAVLVLVGLAGYAAWQSGRASNEAVERAGTAVIAPRDTRPSVAVIPFSSTTSDSADDHFSDGLADELIGSLGKLAGLRVAARTSSFALKGKALGAQAIAESLGVATVLEMSVRRAGNRIKVITQLVSASDGGAIWSQTYDREMNNVFALQEEIARAIVGALRVQLGGTSGPLVRPGTADLAAYELYLKGRHFMYRYTAVDFQLAIDYFNQAIARDPAFAQAFAGLADAHMLRSIFLARSMPDDLPLIRTAAAKALALDSTIAEPHVALASVLVRFDWDFPAAEKALERALALDPGHASAHLRYGILLQYQGRFREAERALERARVLDPLSMPVLMVLASVHLRVGRPDRAVSLLRQVIAATPYQAIAHSQLGHAYLTQGKPDDALAAFRRAALLSGAQDSAHLAYALAMTGRRAEAEGVVLELVSSSRERYVPPVAIALAYVGLSNADSAFRWLDQAYQERAAFMDGLKTTVVFEPLHKDPRWERLLRRMGLEP